MIFQIIYMLGETVQQEAAPKVTPLEAFNLVQANLQPFTKGIVGKPSNIQKPSLAIHRPSCGTVVRNNEDVKLKKIRKYDMGNIRTIWKR